MIQLSQQSCLIIQKTSRSQTSFEIQKQGLEFLRSLGTKHPRIIFNVTIDTDITSFNKSLLNLNQRNSSISLPLGDAIATLTVCIETPELPDDEMLVVLNARSYNGQPAPYLMAIGYLVASLVVIHQQGPSNPQKIEISRHLTSFSKVKGVRDNNQPHLLYLLHDVKNKLSEDFFRNLKKSQFDLLQKYFPERTVSNLHQPEINKIVDRLKCKLRSCITNGKAMTVPKFQLLLTQFCSQLNQNREGFDINQIKLSVSSKYRSKILTEAVQLYRKLLSRELPSDNMPFSEEELSSMRRHIDMQIFKWLLQIGFLDILPQFNKEQQTIWSQLASTNSKAKQQLTYSLYGELTASNWLGTSIQQMIYEATCKLETFVSRTIDKQCLSRLIVETLSKIQDNVLEKLRQIDRLEQENTQIKQQLQGLRENYERLQMRYEMERDQSDILRQTILEKSGREQNLQELVQDIIRLKLKIKNYKEVTDGQQIQIDNLYELIDSYKCILGEGSKNKTYIPNLMAEFNNSVGKFVKAYEKLQQEVPNFLKQLNKKRDQVYRQTIKDSKEISQLNMKLNKMYRQIDTLKIALKVSQETVLTYAKMLKVTPEEVQSKMEEETKKHVELAQLQSKVFVYEKYLDLLKICKNDRKTEPLDKFVRSIGDKKIKARLEGITI